MKMAGQSAGNIPLSAVNPQFLNANSTSHTWPFGAFAELIDNAYDPDVNAKQQWIDCTRIGNMDCLIFMDNGTGLNYNKMLKMMSFGFSDKKSIRGHDPVGQYGNGFKSGSMRLGKDVIVFSKTKDTMSMGLLSQTYLEAIQAQNVVVPIVTCSLDGEPKFSDVPEHGDSLKAILKHSLFKTEAELLQELQAINTIPHMESTGTRIIIWNLRSSEGKMEFDFQKDRYDIQIPREDSDVATRHQDLCKDSEPKSLYSLREYCSILYLKPRMQINIRGKKVRTQLICKSLAYTKKDQYTPKFLKRPIKITFGYNTTNKENYGIMMYYKKRLIRAYEHVGCQRKVTPKGVGVIGIIECDFLKPTHNKQDFDATEEYRILKQRLGEKLEDYWKEIRYRKGKNDPNGTVEVEDMEKSPDQEWVQCNSCQKWRKLPDGIDAKKLPDEWFCHLNPDPQYRTCQAEEEQEDSEDEQPYQKTYKQENKQQQEKNRQQNAEAAIPAPSTSTTPSSCSGTSRHHNAAAAGVDVTPPTNNGLSCSGRKLFAQHTAFSSTLKTPRSKRGLFPPENKRVKRSNVQSTSSAADMELLLQQMPWPTPDILPLAEEIRASMSPCNPSEVERVREASKEQDPQFSDGALSVEFMDFSPSAIAVAPPAVKQQISISTQTEGLSKVKEEPEEERETRELTDSDGVHTLQIKHRDSLLEQLEAARKESDQYKEQMEMIIQERDHYRDQVETANQVRDQSRVEVEKVKQELQQMKTESGTQEQSGADDLALQLDSTFRDLIKSNNERDELKSELERVEAERGALFSQCEQLRTELKDLREAGTRALSPSPAQGTGNSLSTSGSTDAERLRSLRLSVRRLLLLLVPDLNLEQVDYETDIIDEILEQYIDGVRYSEAT